MTRDHFLSIYITKAGLDALSANGTRTCEDFRDKVERVTIENAGDSYEASFCIYTNDSNVEVFTGWEGAQS